MPAINVTRFLGIAPKIAAHLLSDSMAQIARNAKLWSQGLRPIDGLALGEALDKDTGNIQTLFRYANNSVWLHWTQDVNAVLGPIHNDTLEKLYFTGTDKPRVTTNDLYNDPSPGTSLPPASYILGIPAPVDTPVASDSAAGNITATATWVYTFVRKFSDGTIEESAPSPVSNSLTLAARQASVTVPDGSITHADYGITHKRLYRSEGGAYFFVVEIAIGNSPATDNVLTQNLGDAIDTTFYLPPPDGMVGLIKLPNGVLAGFKDNVVYLSEPFNPHAYPLRNQYAVGSKIIGLGNVGTSVIVVTNDRPEFGRGVDPGGYSFKAAPGAFPCTSKRSIASGELGVFWSTPRGMALSDGVSVTLATHEFLTRKEWQRDFHPDTIHGVVHDGRYFGWFWSDLDVDDTRVGGGFVLDRTEQAFLTTLGEYVYAAHSIPESDALHVVKRNPQLALVNFTYVWEGNPASAVPYDWKSKLWITPGSDNFAFAQIVAGYDEGFTEDDIAAIEAEIAAIQAQNAAQADTFGELNAHVLHGNVLNGDNVLVTPPSADVPAASVTFRYWVDGVLEITRNVLDSDPFPLPAGRMGDRHEFQVSGAIQIYKVSLATSMEELART